MDLYNLAKIEYLGLEPQDEAGYNEWASQNDVVQFLENESDDK